VSEVVALADQKLADLDSRFERGRVKQHSLYSARVNASSSG